MIPEEGQRQCIPKDVDISAQHEMMSLLHKVRKKKNVQQKPDKEEKPTKKMPNIKLNDQESFAFLEAGMYSLGSFGT